MLIIPIVLAGFTILLTFIVFIKLCSDIMNRVIFDDKFYIRTTVVLALIICWYMMLNCKY